MRRAGPWKQVLYGLEVSVINPATVEEAGQWMGHLYHVEFPSYVCEHNPNFTINTVGITMVYGTNYNCL